MANLAAVKQSSPGSADNAASAQSGAQQATIPLPATAVSIVSGPANAPDIATKNFTVPLDIEGLDKSQTGSVTFAFHPAEVDKATGLETASARVEVSLKGIIHALDADGASVSPTRRGANLVIAVDGDTDPKLQELNAIASTIQDGAKPLYSSYGDRRAMEAARATFERAFDALLDVDTKATLTQELGLGDPRTLALKRLIDASKDLKQLDEDLVNALPLRNLVAIATGEESIVVREKTGAGKVGNVEQTEFDVTVNGIEARVSGRHRDDGSVESATAYLNAFRAIPLNSQLGVAHEAREIEAVCSGLLPRADAAQVGDSIFDAPALRRLLDKGDLSEATNLEIGGVGHLHEKGDELGTIFNNVPVKAGRVFEFEGRIESGSRILAEKGSTLIIQHQPGAQVSEVELVLSPGVKVMGNLAGMKISGSLAGVDFSEANLSGVTFGNNLEGKPITWKDCKGMIYNASKCSPEILAALKDHSSEFKDIANLRKVDLENLDIVKLKGLCEKFEVEDLAGGFIVMGKNENEGSFVFENPKFAGPADGKVMVMPLRLAPGQSVFDLDESTLRKMGDGPVFNTKHQALIEILRQRGVQLNGAQAAKDEAIDGVQVVDDA
jgi:hypothetical protein